MSLRDKFRFNFWRPMLCRFGGHRIVCYRVISEYDYMVTDHWMWWCHRCMDMRDYDFPCGGCNNGCRKRGVEESGSV